MNFTTASHPVYPPHDRSAFLAETNAKCFSNKQPTLTLIFSIALGVLFRRIVLVSSIITLSATSNAEQPISVPFVQESYPITADPNAQPWTSLVETVEFNQNWENTNTHPKLHTSVKAYWSENYLNLLWEASLEVLPDDTTAENVSGDEYWGLWQGDIVELLIGSDPDIKLYKEFVVSPDGRRIDLSNDKNQVADESYDFEWDSGWETMTRIDEEKGVWYSEWRIPLAAIRSNETAEGMHFRANFFRIGMSDNSLVYMAWRPTMSKDRPAFHVPEKFGEIILSKTPE